MLVKNIINSSKFNRKCPYKMVPVGISIHNTFNDASAKNEISYMHNNNYQTSFHIAVDDKEAIQGLPLDRNSWSCGDGQGQGNRKHISIEICYSKSGGERFKKAEQRAAKVVAYLLKQYGWGIDKIKAHRDFAKKNCPHRTNMSEFKKLVQKELNGSSNNLTQNVFKKGSYKGRRARVTVDILNVRYYRGTNYKIIAKLKRGQVVNLNWYEDNWISIEGYKGNKGLGYIHTDYIELI